jgi:hypothetical protein
MNILKRKILICNNCPHFLSNVHRGTSMLTWRCKKKKCGDGYLVDEIVFFDTLGSEIQQRSSIVKWNSLSVPEFCPYYLEHVINEKS